MPLTPEQFLALGLDPALIFKAIDYQPDPWQQDLLRSPHPRVILCCSRQAGKSTTVAALAIHQALFTPGIACLGKCQVGKYDNLEGVGCRPLQVIHTVGEAFPMWEEQKAARFQQLRQRQRESVLTEAEQAELALLVEELDAAEATYLTAATERLRQERE